MKKIFISIAFIFSINSNAFDDLYLSCANDTHFFGITQTIKQRLQDMPEYNQKKITVKHAASGFNQFESGGHEGHMLEKTIDIPYFGYIDRVSGALHEEYSNADSNYCNPVEDIRCLSKPRKPKTYRSLGSCKTITKSQALAGAKRVGFKAKTKTKF